METIRIKDRETKEYRTIEFEPEKELELGEARENPWAIIEALDKNSMRATYYETQRADAVEWARSLKSQLKILESLIKVDLKDSLSRSGPKPTIPDVENGYNAFYLAYVEGLKECDVAEDGTVSIKTEDDAEVLDIGLLEELISITRELREAERAEVRLRAIAGEQKDRLGSLKEIAKLLGQLISSEFAAMDAKKVISVKGKKGFRGTEAL